MDSKNKKIMTGLLLIFLLILSFPVLAEEKELVSISVNTVPDKVRYGVGQPLSEDGLSIECYYSDGTAEVRYDGFLLSGYDAGMAGTKEILVTYENQNTTFLVVVAERYAISMEAKMINPDKHIIVQGEEIHKQDIQCIITYDNGEKEENTSFELDASDLEFVGNRYVQVVSGNLSASVRVTVKENELERIKILQLPPTRFLAGTAFTWEGLQAAAVYTDGSQRDITDSLNITRPKMSEIGMQMVTIEFEGYKETYEIEIYEGEIQQIDTSWYGVEKTVRIIFADGSELFVEENRIREIQHEDGSIELLIVVNGRMVREMYKNPGPEPTDAETTEAAKRVSIKVPIGFQARKNGTDTAPLPAYIIENQSSYHLTLHIQAAGRISPLALDGFPLTIEKEGKKELPFTILTDEYQEEFKAPYYFHIRLEILE